MQPRADPVQTRALADRAPVIARTQREDLTHVRI
jgi:hypothetical protein